MFCGSGSVAYAVGFGGAPGGGMRWGMGNPEISTLKTLLESRPYWDSRKEDNMSYE